MSKTLTKELIDQIVFGMENQEQEFYLDLETMEVVPESAVGDIDQLDFDDSQNPDTESISGPRYLPLPPWQSVDGFNLMERFVQNLHNPLARTELHRILLSGRGVFRQFKDILRQYPEVAKKWYRFKDRAMYDTVVQWFTDTMETWGISYTEPDYEDTGDLILDDFQSFHGSAETILDILTKKNIACDVEFLYLQNRDELFSDPLESHFWTQKQGRKTVQNSDILGALATPGGDLAGIVWIQTHISLAADGEDRIWGTLELLYVSPEFRGLGCAQTLMNLVLPEVKTRNLERVFWDIPSKAQFLLPMAQDGGFVSSGTLMIKKPIS